MIDSSDTAVVAVYASIPAGAPRLTRIDLAVEAIGAQTRSLDGGILLPTDLKIFDVSAAGAGIIAGRALARARGPVFTSPSTSDLDPRRGLVIGGAHTIEDRTIRLNLVEPSYSAARRIQRRINERFGHTPKTAEALSQGYLELQTPPKYADDPARFLELLPHVLLESAPEYLERRLRDLSRHIDADAATLDHLSSVWEGIGRTAIPHLQALYRRDRLAASFYAARAGLRLGDVTALPIMEQISLDAKHPYRIASIRELGACGMLQAAGKLARLLDDREDEIRIAAYRALLNYHHPAIRSERFSNSVDPTMTSLTLDVVRSSAKPLIYVRRNGEPRVAIFGERMPVVAPVYYNHPHDLVTVNAVERDGNLAVFSRTRAGHRLSEKLDVPARVTELIRAMAGLPFPDTEGHYHALGLHFSLIVEVLDQLSRDGSLGATVVLEGIDLRDLPKPAPERPEGDELPPLEFDPPADREEGGDQKTDEESP